MPTCALKLRHFHKWNAAGLRCAPPARERGSRMRPTSAGLYFHCAAGLIQDPLTRAHVRLLGPCFKTGRVGDRSTRRKPSITPASLASSQQRRSSVRATNSLRATTPLRTPATLLISQFKEETTKPSRASLLPRSANGPSCEMANNRRHTRGAPPATFRLSLLRPSTNRLRRPSGGKQMRQFATQR